MDHTYGMLTMSHCTHIALNILGLLGGSKKYPAYIRIYMYMYMFRDRYKPWVGLKLSDSFGTVQTVSKSGQTGLKLA